MYPETDATLNVELLRLLPMAPSFVSASDTTGLNSNRTDSSGHLLSSM